MTFKKKISDLVRIKTIYCDQEYGDVELWTEKLKAIVHYHFILTIFNPCKSI